MAVQASISAKQDNPRHRNIIINSLDEDLVD
jgi:hypothetical protein